MRNLLLFLIRFHTFFLLLVLEVICLFLIVRNNSFQRTGYASASSTISGNVYNTYHGLEQYFGLKAKNEMLAKENAWLRAQLRESYYKDAFELGQVSDTAFKPLYTFIPSKVINNSIYKTNNYLTLNKGSNQGIYPQMGVIGSNGVVGVVRTTSGNFASVMSVLHRNISISAKLKKDRSLGSLIWEGLTPEKATLLDIPHNIKVAMGDSVVTTGFGASFPPDIMIGVVDKITQEKGDNFYTISVKLSTQFDQLEHVYVVNNMMKTERVQLEKERKDD